MDDCFGVEKFVELIFVKQFKVTSEMTEPDSSFPVGLLLNHFPEKLHHIMFARNVIQDLKWIDYFDIYTSDMLPTQESYLKKIIYACYLDYYGHTMVFDGFISLCSYVRYFCFEISKKKGMNFFHLNSLIVMAFFEKEVKKSFLKCGGFQRLLVCIRDHRYHKWNWSLKDMVVVENPFTCVDPVTFEYIQKESKREDDTLKSVQKNESVMKKSTDYIAQKVLSMLSVDLFSLQDCQDSNQTVGATGLQDEAKTVEKKTQADPKPLKKVFQGSSLKKTVYKKTKKQADLKPVKKIFQGNSLKKTVEENPKIQEELKALKEVSNGSSTNKTVDGKTKLQADLNALKDVLQESSSKNTVDEKTKIQADLGALKEVSQGSSLNKTVDENAKIQADLGPLKKVSQESSLKKTVDEKTKTQTNLKPLKEVSQESLNSDSNTIPVAKQEEDKLWYQSIVQAVTRHNQLKTASFETSDTSTLKRVEKIRERMKDSIKSLIEVLNEYSKE